jgi:hypothetical protein
MVHVTDSLNLPCMDCIYCLPLPAYICVPALKIIRFYYKVCGNSDIVDCQRFRRRTVFG